MGNNNLKHASMYSLLLLLAMVLSHPTFVLSDIQQFDWKIVYTNITRLCNTKTVITVNGQFPGPTQYVREGDTVIVNVTNLVSENVTIHWHGIRQLLSGWADGPAYITQCPIQSGRSYVHKFQVIGQRGTLFWHAHVSWLRATLYGGFFIRPRLNDKYPFSTPFNEIPVIIGEWWNRDVEEVVEEALHSGAGYSIPEAITINGQPGALYGNCSLQDTPVFSVRKGNTYLLRIVNAAVNFQMYFAVTNHSLTVVEADAEYTKSLPTNVVLLAPGQTLSVQLTANQAPGNRYLMVASIYSPAPANLVPYPSTPATMILAYDGVSTTRTRFRNHPNSSRSPTPVPQSDMTSGASELPMPTFPAVDDINFEVNFTQSVRAQPYSTGYYYMDTPKDVKEDLLYTLGYSYLPCGIEHDCVLGTGYRLAAAVNNVSFVFPTTSLLQAYYEKSEGVYTTDFPDRPPFLYDFAGAQLENKVSVTGTKVKLLDFNTTVQIVFQGTSALFHESHPVHLHGQNFYIVGVGLGSFDPVSDPPKFNLLDPPSRNTVSVPAGGWAAVRFRTLNPGVWYMHCHIDMHVSWGMSMAFIVKNGVGTKQSLPPPPSDLPPC